jgi:hypothetical protein
VQTGRRLVLERLEDRTLLNGHTLATAGLLNFNGNVATASGFLSPTANSDLFALNLQSGDTITAIVDAQKNGLSALDSTLRVLDGTGASVAFNDDTDGRDPRLTFQAAAAGTYYVMVSGHTLPASGAGVAAPVPAASSGLYNLRLLKQSTSLAPDIEVASFRILQDGSLWGDTVPVSYAVENRGGAAAGKFQVELRLSVDTRSNATGLLLMTVAVPGLPAGASTGGTLSVTLPGAPGAPPPSFPEPGQVFLGLRIQTDGMAPGTNTTVTHSPHRGTDSDVLEILTPQARSASGGTSATPSIIGPNARLTGTIKGPDGNSFKVTLAQMGQLKARLTANGFLPRLSLLDSTGKVIASGRPMPGSPDALVVQSLAGDVTGIPYFLKVQSDGGSGAYTLTTEFFSGFGELGPLVGSMPAALVARDFDNDGVTDLAVGNATGITVLLGSGSGTFRQSQQLATLGSQPSPMLSAPNLLNQPGTPPVPMPFQPTLLVVGDWEGNGNLGLAAASPTSTDLDVFQGDGDGTFQPLERIALGFLPTVLAVGDFNGDGIDDLVVAGPTLEVFLGRRDGTFQLSAQLPSPVPNPTSLVVADFTRNGVLDLAMAGSGSVSMLLLGVGDGTFQPPMSVGIVASRLVAADFTGDGLPDLAAVGGTFPGVTLLLGRGDGTFGLPLPVAFVPGAAKFTTLLAADINGNGLPDVVATGPDGSGVILINLGGALFQSALPLATGGAGTALVAADFFGDGRLDLVAVGPGASFLLSTGGGIFSPFALPTPPAVTPLPSSKPAEPSALLPSSVGVLEAAGSGTTAVVALLMLASDITQILPTTSSGSTEPSSGQSAPVSSTGFDEVARTWIGSLPPPPSDLSPPSERAAAFLLAPDDLAASGELAGLLQLINARPVVNLFPQRNSPVASVATLIAGDEGERRLAEDNREEEDEYFSPRGMIGLDPGNDHGPGAGAGKPAGPAANEEEAQAPAWFPFGLLFGEGNGGLRAWSWSLAIILVGLARRQPLGKRQASSPAVCRQPQGQHPARA